MCFYYFFKSSDLKESFKMLNLHTNAFNEIYGFKTVGVYKEEF